MDKCSIFASDQKIEYMAHLTKEQRYVISVLRKRGLKQKEIAQEIGVSASTISRELKRNSGKRGGYHAETAHSLSQERKERYCCNRKFTPSVEKRIRNHLEKEQWSPEQISGYCKTNGIKMVCVERIYQFIRQDKQHGGELYKHLRHKLKHRKRTLQNDCKVRIKDRVSIEERDEKINNREEFGHWEGDLIEGKDHKGFALVLTERVSKHTFIDYLPRGKVAKEVAKAVINSLLPYKEWVLSITFDNGLEFAEHQAIAKKLETKIFFTHPYCSWEKGQVENMNKLIRQYIPKNEPITKDNMMNIKEIQYKLNSRPRKNLNYQKPFKIFYKFVNKKIAFAS